MGRHEEICGERTQGGLLFARLLGRARVDRDQDAIDRVAGQ